MHTSLRILAGLLVPITLLAIGGCDRSRAPEAPADTVFQGGQVFTVDASRSVAEAVAIRDGRIVYVGTDAGAAAHIGADTEVVDLGGRMMLPGFQDAHIHPIWGGLEVALCDLNGLDSADEYRAAIAEYAAANPDAEWIHGGGWVLSNFDPGTVPRDFLDDIVPGRPVFLTSADGHSGWANSRALEIAGIDRETPDPFDGRIDHVAGSGEPDGSLQEGAQYILTKHLPPTSLADREAAIRYAQDMLNAFGFTSVREASAIPAELDAYRALDRRGELRLRVSLSLRWDRERALDQVGELAATREEYSGGLLRPIAIKMYQDGVMENFTAVMLDPYLLPEETFGIPMVEPELLKRAVTALDAAGFQVSIHAIGDGAARQSLDAIEASVRANGQLDNRHQLVHLELIDPTDIPRFAELGVVASFSPLWAFPDEAVTELTAPFIGEERTKRLYPIGSVQAAGGLIAFGSDWSVSTPDPFHGMETAIRRSNPEEGPSAATLNSDEAIDLDSAIAAYTINAAWADKTEADTGSIEVGKYADLVVIDRNLFDLEPEDISEARVLLTLLGGRAVYGSVADL